jgi:hypothetical protein
LSESEFTTRMVKYPIRIYGGFSSNPKSNTMGPGRLQHDRPSACVIAQQYSSSTLASLRCHSYKEKLGAH